MPKDRLLPSELILNKDGSIYHLNLLPEHSCQNVITVGDPNRVAMVSKYFDTIDYTTSKREIITHIGTLNGSKIMVISTGMGTDNIDIVLSELDALANIDFKTRTIKPNFTPLNFFRIGTSGSIQKNINVGSFLLTQFAIGLDGLLYFYKNSSIRETNFEQSLLQQISILDNMAKPYVVKADVSQLNKFNSTNFILGTTLTCNGFYGPQGRKLRIPLAFPLLNKEFEQFNFKGNTITNLEMETSALYGLSKIMGHTALSFNCILANRVTGDFIKKPNQKIEELIQLVLKDI